MRNYEIVCHTDDIDWLDHRDASIGASEVAALFGAHPYTDWDTLVQEKASGVAGFTGNRHTWWGQWCEKSNMEAFSVITGLRTRHCGLMLRSTKQPLLSATLDGLVAAPTPDRPVGASPDGTLPVKDEDQIQHFFDDIYGALDEGYPVGALEMKQTSVFSRKYWADAPARDGKLSMFWHQVQAQMYVSGLTWAVLCGRVGVSDMVAHLVWADPEFHEELEEKAAEFWKEVEDAR